MTNWFTLYPLKREVWGALWARCSLSPPLTARSRNKGKLLGSRMTLGVSLSLETAHPYPRELERTASPGCRALDIKFVISGAL